MKNVKDHIPELQATAKKVLPGFRQARAVLDVYIHVLEYFEEQVAIDVANGTATPLRGIEPSLVREAEQVRAMMGAFGKLIARGE
jgi:hypothetical protein